MKLKPHILCTHILQFCIFFLLHGHLICGQKEYLICNWKCKEQLLCDFADINITSNLDNLSALGLKILPPTEAGFSVMLPNETACALIDQLGSPKPPICQPTITTFGCRELCRDDLIFEDNFDTMDWKKWQPEIRIPMEVDDAEFVSYQNRTENCYVEGGQLHIVPTWTNETHGKLDLLSSCTAVQEIECYQNFQKNRVLPPIVTARIGTQKSLNFRYGRIEVRAKLPKGDWLFPLILLESSENAYGTTNYSSGQMRVAFTRGNEVLFNENGKDINGNRVLGGVVLVPGATFRGNWLQERQIMEHVGNAFHTYTLNWTDQYISLGMDGHEYGRFKGQFRIPKKLKYLPHSRLWKLGRNMAPFDREFFITLGVAAGGNSDFPDVCVSNNNQEKPWNNTDPSASTKFTNNTNNWIDTWNGADTGLHVDYVRVYAI